MVANFVYFYHYREQQSLLVKCAATALSSKLIAHQKDFFSKMVVDAVSLLDDMLPLNMIGVKKVQGGSLEVGLTHTYILVTKTPSLDLERFARSSKIIW